MTYAKHIADKRSVPHQTRKIYMATSRDKPPNEAVTPVSDIPHSPFIYFEASPAFGFTAGVINLTLSANRIWIGKGGVESEQVVVAYLRGNVQAAANLRRAIDAALALAAPPPETSN
jgi:hypothetical protein